MFSTMQKIRTPYAQGKTGLFINFYPTAVKLFLVLPVRSFLRDGPLNRWACLTTHLTIHVYKL